MADRRGYDIIWKKGSWFEKGGWVLKPRKSASEKAGETIVIYLILGAILFLILSIIVLTLPIWSVLIGLQMVREKRYIAGIISVCALGYFFIDINNQWLTSFIFTGNYNSEGEFSEGFFGLKNLEYLQKINLIAVGLGIGYIFDGVLISKYGKKYNDNRITKSQIIIYLFPVIMFSFFLMSDISYSNKTNKNQDNFIQKEVSNVQKEELYYKSDRVKIEEYEVKDSISQNSTDKIQSSDYKKYEIVNPLIEDNYNIDKIYTNGEESENGGQLISNQKYDTGEVKLKVLYYSESDIQKFLSYHRNGVLQSITFYKNGKAFGERFLTNEKGILYLKETFSNGLRNGESISYELNGDKLYVKEKGIYKDDYRDGKWITYEIWMDSDNITYHQEILNIEIYNMGKIKE